MASAGGFLREVSPRGNPANGELHDTLAPEY
jgi:hypothetical protein